MKKSIILGSSSPRRKQLLEEIGLTFEIISPIGDEVVTQTNNLSEAILAIALIKNQEVQTMLRDRVDYDNLVIITADTMVTIDGLLLGKADNVEQARKYLNLISGKTHEVITGHIIFDTHTDTYYQKAISTSITLKQLSDDEIEEYLASDEWVGKAGAYAGQGIAGKYITNISGDYPSFIGISKSYIYETLKLL